MKMSVSTINAKGVTTVPSWVLKMFDLKPNSQIVWKILKSGKVRIVPISKKMLNK